MSSIARSSINIWKVFRSIAGAAIRGGGVWAILLAFFTLVSIVDYGIFLDRGTGVLFTNGHVGLGIVLAVGWAVIFLSARRSMQYGCQRESFFS